MKLTRYFQSCLLVESGEARLLIDASGAESGNLEAFGRLDAVLYTHEHGDHFDAGVAASLVSRGAVLYANDATARHLDGTAHTVVTDGMEFSAGGVTVKAIELPHCLMTDGSPGPRNTGFLIGTSLFHSGDGVELEGFTVENLAAPLTGPDVSIKDAFSFASSTGAKKYIPIHYDYIGTKPEVAGSFASSTGMPFEVMVLPHGKPTEL